MVICCCFFLVYFCFCDFFFFSFFQLILISPKTGFQTISHTESYLIQRYIVTHPFLSGVRTVRMRRVLAPGEHPQFVPYARKLCKAVTNDDDEAAGRPRDNNPDAGPRPRRRGTKRAHGLGDDGRERGRRRTADPRHAGSPPVPSAVPTVIPSSVPAPPTGALLTDQVVYHHETAASVAALLAEHVVSNAVSIGGREYRQVSGIPQGSVMSSLLCSVLYGDFERRTLTAERIVAPPRGGGSGEYPTQRHDAGPSHAFGASDVPRAGDVGARATGGERSGARPGRTGAAVARTAPAVVLTAAHDLPTATGDIGLLIRLIDDSLYVTTSLDSARRYVNLMHQPHPEYGCVVNPSKTWVSFDHTVTVPVPADGGSCAGAPGNGPNTNSTGPPQQDGSIPPPPPPPPPSPPTAAAAAPTRQVPLRRANVIPWIGLTVDARTFALAPDERRNPRDSRAVDDSLTVAFHASPGKALLRGVRSLLRVRCHPLLLDARVNEAVPMGRYVLF
jgi:hypothetical protein